MANKITVTSVIGPGITDTTHIFNNIRSILFNETNQVLTVVDENNVVRNYDLYGTTTVTYTISSHSATVAASQ